MLEEKAAASVDDVEAAGWLGIQALAHGGALDLSKLKKHKGRAASEVQLKIVGQSCYLLLLVMK